jgi:hypothetical protein
MESAPYRSREFRERFGYVGVGQDKTWQKFVAHNTICQEATGEQMADSGLNLIDLTD